MRPHALTVDLEDWYHPLLLRPGANPSISLMEAPTHALLGMLAERRILATFFVVGEVAGAHPGLLRRIAEAGHEIGCHTHAHVALWELTPQSFETELERAERAIEQACGVRPRLFRGASFGLSPRTRWIGDILARRGYLIDSSLLPSPFAMAGWAKAPRGPFVLTRGLWEIPASTSPLLRLPYGGSIYLRVWPRSLISSWVRANERRGLPSVFYIHPWELLPSLPSTPRARRGRWVTLWGQRRFVRMLEWLLDTFPLAPVSEAFRPLLVPDEWHGSPVARGLVFPRGVITPWVRRGRANQPPPRSGACDPRTPG